MMKKRSILPIAILFITLFSCQVDSEQYTKDIKAKLQAKKYEEALTLSQKALKDGVQPEDPIYNFMGVAELNKGNKGAALDFFSKAIKLNATNYKYFYNRGNTYRFLNQPQEAFDDYTKALALDQSQADIYLNRAHTQINLNLLQEAIIDLNKAFELRKGDKKEILLKRAETHLRLENMAESENDLRKYIKLDKQNGKAYFMLAMALISDKGDNDEEACQLVQLGISLEYQPAVELQKLHCQDYIK